MHDSQYSKIITPSIKTARDREYSILLPLNGKDIKIVADESDSFIISRKNGNLPDIVLTPEILDALCNAREIYHNARYITSYIARNNIKGFDDKRAFNKLCIEYNRLAKKRGYRNNRDNNERLLKTAIENIRKDNLYETN